MSVENMLNRALKLLQFLLLVDNMSKKAKEQASAETLFRWRLSLFLPLALSFFYFFITIFCWQLSEVFVGVETRGYPKKTTFLF